MDPAGEPGWAGRTPADPRGPSGVALTVPALGARRGGESQSQEGLEASCQVPEGRAGGVGRQGQLVSFNSQPPNS